MALGNTGWGVTKPRFSISIKSIFLIFCLVFGLVFFFFFFLKKKKKVLNCRSDTKQVSTFLYVISSVCASDLRGFLASGKEELQCR